LRVTRRSENDASASIERGESRITPATRFATTDVLAF